MTIIVVDLFHQNYDAGDGLPPHWAVKYFMSTSGWPQYFYCETYEEAEEWIRKNAGNADSFI